MLLALLLAALRGASEAAGPAGRGGRRDTGEKRRVGLRPAWRGYAMPAIALLAWVLAGGFSAGIVLRAAETLGTPVAPGYRGDDAYPLVVPLAYRWVAAAAFALAVAAVLSAVFVWVRAAPVEADDDRLSRRPTALPRRRRTRSAPRRSPERGPGRRS